MVRRIIKLYDINGKTFVVKYLKICYIMTVIVLSGSKYTVSPGDPIIGTTKEGLPRIIPIAFREGILTNSQPEITRVVLSIFSLYRVIRIPSILKLNTITDGFNGTHQSIDSNLIRKGIVRL